MPRGKRTVGVRGDTDGSLPAPVAVFNPIDPDDLWRERHRMAFFRAIQEHPKAKDKVLGRLASDVLPLAAELVVTKGVAALGSFHRWSLLANLPDEAPPIKARIESWGESIGLKDDWVLEVALRTVGAWAEWLARLNGRDPAWLKAETRYGALPKGDEWWRCRIAIDLTILPGVNVPLYLGNPPVSVDRAMVDSLDALKERVSTIGKAWCMPTEAGDGLMSLTRLETPFDRPFQEPPSFTFKVYPTQETPEEMHERLDRLIAGALDSLREQGFRDPPMARAKRDDTPDAHFRWLVEYQILAKDWTQICAPGAGPRGVQNGVVKLINLIGLTPRATARS